MQVDKKLRHSKKAVAVGIALLNLNFIFILAAFRTIPVDIVTHMITAVFTLTGIYLGTQGGVDMVQSSKLETVRDDSISRRDRFPPQPQPIVTPPIVTPPVT